MPKFLSKVDPLVLVPALLLSGFGLLMIYSVSFTSDQSFFYRQLAYFFVGLGLFFVVSRLDFKTLSNYSPFLYLFVILLLLITAFFGEKVQGSTRWIDLGFVTLQPSEIAKPILILFFADFFTRFPPKNLKNILASILLAIVPVLLVFQQPDFGNAFLLASLWAFMLFIAGLSLILVVASIVTGFLLSPLLWSLLKDYQKTRVLSFLNLSSDPQGAGYNVVQALIAFGSGRAVGKGLGKGTQSHLDFLPAEKTDFIFAATGEELGFVGISLLLLIFSFLIAKLLKLASEIGNQTGRILVYSVGFSIFLQFFINTGVNIGLFPVTGITLPFVSFGGSSLVSLFISLGLVQSAKNSSEKYDRVLTG